MMKRMRTLHLPLAVAAALAVGWSGYLPATGHVIGVTAALAGPKPARAIASPAPARHPAGDNRSGARTAP